MIHYAGHRGRGERVRRLVWRVVAYPAAVASVWFAITWSLRANAEEPSAATPKRPSVTRASSRPSPAVVQRVVADYFSKKEGYEPGDLITRHNVQAILKQLRQRGIVPKDAKEILQAALPENHFLVELSRSTRGRRFLRKTKNEELIYDRLDRIAGVPNGQRMLRDLVKLPDAHRYAPMRPAQGTPSMLDLLPKRGSSRTRTIPNYAKPTGRIYTEADLVKRLRESLR